jgi:acetyltransferase
MTLKAFFEPASIAVIGASSNPAKLGHAVLKNIVEGGYARHGKIYPINTQAREILGYPAYPSVLAVPEPIDLAVILIPYPYVPDVLRTCGQKGIPAAIVISAGFREAGMEGLERERELIAIAREFNIRLIGPNCLGVVDTFTPLNATFAAGAPPRGPMAFTSQSGALGIAILDWAQAGRLGLSKFVSLGNKADVDEVDLLRAWCDDKHTRVILIYSEELYLQRRIVQWSGIHSRGARGNASEASHCHQVRRDPIRRAGGVVTHRVIGRVRASLPDRFSPGRCVANRLIGIAH